MVNKQTKKPLLIFFLCIGNLTSVGLTLAWDSTSFFNIKMHFLIIMYLLLTSLLVLISFPSGTPVMFKFLKIILTLLDLPYSSGFPHLNMFILWSAFGDIFHRSSKLLACSSSIETVYASVTQAKAYLKLK